MPRQKPLAILLPCYNSARTLPVALRSVLKLETDLEAHIDHLLLCDDGSVDGSDDLAATLWTSHTVPLVVRRAESNVGEFGNVNAGIAAMPPHVRWVLLMHSDNEALPAWIRVLARECDRAPENVAIVCGSWEFVVDGDISNAGDARGEDCIEDIPGDRQSIRKTLLNGCWWHNGAAAVRVSAWKEIGGHPFDTPFEGPLAILGLRRPRADARRLRSKGDWDTLLRTLSSGWTVRYVATPLVRYIDNLQGLSNGSFFTHIDLLETLQVVRRHQFALRLPDIFTLHAQVSYGLVGRLVVSLARGHWRRAINAALGLPIVPASLFASLSDALRGKGGVLARIPFRFSETEPSVEGPGRR